MSYFSHVKVSSSSNLTWTHLSRAGFNRYCIQFIWGGYWKKNGVRLLDRYANHIPYLLPLEEGATRALQCCVLCWSCRTAFIWGWISFLRCSSSCTIVTFYLCAIKRSYLRLNYVIVDSDVAAHSPLKHFELMILGWRRYSYWWWAFANTVATVQERDVFILV